MTKFFLRKIILKLLELLRPVNSFVPLKIKYFIKEYFINPLSFSDDFIYASYGDLNSDKTILIIGGHNAGLYSIIHSVIGYLTYAEEKGYSPVIDYQNNKTFYHDKSFNGNLWEAYFRQPSEISLEDVYLSKSVVHTPMSFPHIKYPSNGLHVIYDTKKTMQIYEIFNKYIRYNEDIKNYIEEVYSNFEGKVLLGVYLRGTDYKTATGHAKQPLLESIFDKIDYFLSKYEDIQGLFVSSEEEETLFAVKDRYGDLVHYQNRLLIKDYKIGQVTPNVFYGNGKDKIRIGTEYLADIEILSRLKYFLSGLSGGSAAVIEKNGLSFKEYIVLFEGFKD